MKMPEAEGIWSCVPLSCGRITPELAGEPFSPGTTHMCVEYSVNPCRWFAAGSPAPIFTKEDRMRIKSIIVVLLASLSVVAHAQTKTGTLIDAQQVQQPNTNTSDSPRTTSVDQPQPAAITVGWNYGHASACVPYYDGTIAWLYVYLAEGSYLTMAFPPHVNLLIPACQSGNLIGFYIANTSGSLSNIQVFPHK
jgi:hypothetical protein